MGHERIKHLKENLLCCIEAQMANLYEADTEELGEAIDMLKDLEEALYYCTVTEAMEGGGSWGRDYEFDADKYQHHDDESRKHMMYDNGSRPMSNYSEPMSRSPYEGRSSGVRRMYMEARDMGKDKTAQIKELEHYIQELSTDVVEMIQEAGTEEKQYLEKKLLALASKIGQMK